MNESTIKTEVDLLNKLYNKLPFAREVVDKYKSLPSILNLLNELAEKILLPLQKQLLPLFKERNSAVLFIKTLPKLFKPKDIVITILDGKQPNKQRAWEIIGLIYLNTGRYYDALSIFFSLYDHMQKAQEEKSAWFHKALPLVWISDCYSSMGCPVLAKRYLMLTLCDDAIREKGIVSPNTTGIYFRLVWGGGLSDAELKRYAKKIYKLYNNPVESRFPEWILQELDQNWMTEFPTPKEASFYIINKKYISYLISKLGDPQGKYLELLSEYILSCMPGCRTKRRRKTESTDYDLICSMEGFEMDFRSEMGRYFVCECKDWKSPADFTTFAKFCRVLDSTKSRFGILFSKSGISGQGKTKHAEREQLKVFQDRGMVIVVIDQNDLNLIMEGESFINILRSKYEKVRLDLRTGKIEK
jgi:tetratricopeptide (TPR) repeat protein